MTFRSLPNNMPNYLDHYMGPYPLNQLIAAQRTLINGFNSWDSRIFDRLHRIMLRENCTVTISDDDDDTDADADKTNGNVSSSGFRSTLTRPPLTNKKRKAEKNDPSLSINIDHGEPELKKAKVEKEEVVEIVDGDDDEEEEEEVEVLPQKGETDDPPEKVPQLVTCYKCDYCQFSSNDVQKCRQHLTEKRHKSCSECKGLLRSFNNVIPKCIMKEMAVENEGKDYYSKIATCIRCKKVFADIFSCAKHYRVEHSVKGARCYWISDVIDFQKIVIPRDCVCGTCNLACETQESLNAHYNKKKHYPYVQPASKVRLLFTCPFCQTEFYEFLEAKAHILDHGMKQPSLRHILNVTYYKLKKQKVKLLPLRVVKKTMVKKTTVKKTTVKKTKPKTKKVLKKKIFKSKSKPKKKKNKLNKIEIGLKQV